MLMVPSQVWVFCSLILLHDKSLLRTCPLRGLKNLAITVQANQPFLKSSFISVWIGIWRRNEWFCSLILGMSSSSPKKWENRKVTENGLYEHVHYHDQSWERNQETRLNVADQTLHEHGVLNTSFHSFIFPNRSLYISFYIWEFEILTWAPESLCRENPQCLVWRSYQPSKEDLSLSSKSFLKVWSSDLKFKKTGQNEYSM